MPIRITTMNKFIRDTESPLISVVVPVFNAEKYILSAIESALTQSIQNIEVIVVDDGSTDNTTELLEASFGTDSRLRIIRLGKNWGGPAVARNTGITESKANIIATLDADDSWHHKKLERQLALIDEHTQFVYCWSARIQPTDSRATKPMHGPQPLFDGDVRSIVLWRNFVGGGSTPLFTRECFQNAGPYDLEANGCEDMLFYIRAGQYTEFGVVPEYLTYYRNTPGSLSKNHDVMLDSMEIIYEKTRKLPAYNDSLRRQAMARTCLGIIRTNRRTMGITEYLHLMKRAFSYDPYFFLRIRILKHAAARLALKFQQIIRK